MDTTKDILDLFDDDTEEETPVPQPEPKRDPVQFRRSRRTEMECIDVPVDFNPFSEEETEPESEPKPEPEEEPVPQPEPQDAPVSTVSAEEFAAMQNQLTLLAEQNARILEQLTLFGGKQAQLVQKIDETNHMVTAHEQIEQRMGKEIDQYRKDFYSSITEPIIAQIISIHVSLVRDLESCKKELAELSEEDTAARTKLQEEFSTFLYYADMVKGALLNCGVDAFSPEPGTKMDQLRHSIAKTVRTDDPEKNGTIESVRLFGYTYNGKILRPAKVAVYKSN